MGSHRFLVLTVAALLPVLVSSAFLPPSKSTSSPSAALFATAPTISGWKVLKDGSVTGRVTNHPDLRDGQVITTSPLRNADSVQADSLVWTKSGHRFLLAEQDAGVKGFFTLAAAHVAGALLNLGGGEAAALLLKKEERAALEAAKKKKATEAAQAKRTARVAALLLKKKQEAKKKANLLLVEQEARVAAMLLNKKDEQAKVEHKVEAPLLKKMEEQVTKKKDVMVDAVFSRSTVDDTGSSSFPEDVAESAPDNAPTKSSSPLLNNEEEQVAQVTDVTVDAVFTDTGSSSPGAVAESAHDTAPTKSSSGYLEPLSEASETLTKATPKVASLSNGSYLDALANAAPAPSPEWPTAPAETTTTDVKADAVFAANGVEDTESTLPKTVSESPRHAAPINPVLESTTLEAKTEASWTSTPAAGSDPNTREANSSTGIGATSSVTTDTVSEAKPTPKPSEGADVDYRKAVEEFYGTAITGPSNSVMSTDTVSEAKPTPKPSDGANVDYGKALEEFYGTAITGPSKLEEGSYSEPRKSVAATTSALYASDSTQLDAAPVPMSVKTDRLRVEVERARQWQDETNANGIPRAPPPVRHEGEL